MTIVIKAENISKQYLIAHQQKARYSTLTENLAGFGLRMVHRMRRPLSSSAGDELEKFDALKDINFEIKQGDRVGIIGRNGAGKSTLLKILSRITEPTTGRIGIKGRVASLLEVGTGFHPELTGRENIFLNGAILGMTKRDIQARFDEIVDFSEVEFFLDTPVKRYSSGMYVRLAFSVAAHLEPDVMIVDEVLAVGDASFQRKCLSKMGEAGGAGTTILFVSHNISAVEALCNRGMVLVDGAAQYYEDLSCAVSSYLDQSYAKQYVDLDKHRRIKDLSRYAEFKRIFFPDGVNLFKSGEDIRFSAEIYAAKNCFELRISLTVLSMSGSPVGSTFSACELNVSKGETKTIGVGLGGVKLAPGKYCLAVSLGKGTYKTSVTDYDILFDVLSFEVCQADGDAAAYGWPASWGGVMLDTLTLNCESYK